ncbi:hypothetical protein BC834DRAFT_552939 [Gloeopeniophorella convolvens]|nr:hypothetical protein BC834DRAFT_552939 [Gloeopeniophorella convolvens]
MALADLKLGAHDAEQLNINAILTLFPVAILYYDYLLTISREICFVWPPVNKLGWVTTIYFLNRYLSMLGHAPVVFSYFIKGNLELYVAYMSLRSRQWLISPSCQFLHTYHEILEFVLQVLGGVLCIIRVHALYGRSRRVLMFLLSLSIVAIIIGCWAIFTDRNSDVESIEVISNIPGCNQYVTTAGGRHPALAWTGVLAFDCVVFALTLYKAFTMGRLGDGDIPYILDVFVRDGAMYFSVLCFVNLANILILRVRQIYVYLLNRSYVPFLPVRPGPSITPSQRELSGCSPLEPNASRSFGIQQEHSPTCLFLSNVVTSPC